MSPAGAKTELWKPSTEFATLIDSLARRIETPIDAPEAGSTPPLTAQA